MGRNEPKHAESEDSIRAIHGMLKGKTNGVRLGIGQINHTIADAGLTHTCASAAFQYPSDNIDHVVQPDRD